MTTSFTIRDFFVYLLSGLLLLICLGSIFLNDIFELVLKLISKYEFLKDSSFLLSIILIPVIYFLGQIIGSLNYILLKIFVCVDKIFKNKGNKMPNWKYFILIKLQQILYRQRVVYAIIKSTKSEKLDKPFKNVDEFWTTCAKLQVEKIYSPAEYWYILNELFNSVNLIFFISTITSFLNRNWILGIIYLILTILAFRRAKQYAGHFIQSVINLTIALQTIKAEK